MPQYLLSVHHRELSFAPDDLAQIGAEVTAWVDKQKADGTFVFAGGLMADGAEAKVVTVDNGSVVTTDGPYLETKELLGGFTVVEATDLDHALELGAEHARASRLPTEVRLFQSA